MPPGTSLHLRWNCGRNIQTPDSIYYNNLYSGKKEERTKKGGSMNHIKKNRWTDITIPVRSGMIAWPGDSPPDIKQVLDISSGDPVNVSVVTMSTHTGTHIDAQRHYIGDGEGIDSLSPETLIGEARVIEVPDSPTVNAVHLAGFNIQKGERILLKTRNSQRRWWEEAFNEDFAYLVGDAARLLVEKGVQLVGIDYLSVAAYPDGSEVHRVLLGAGICIVEGLELSQVGAGRYDFVCLPLRFVHGDGSPVRAMVRRIKPLSPV